MTAGHRGCSTDDRLYIKTISGPHLTCRSPTRTKATRDNIGTLKSGRFVWEVNFRSYSNGRFLPETGHLRGLARLGNLAGLYWLAHRRARKDISESILLRVLKDKPYNEIKWAITSHWLAQPALQELITLRSAKLHVILFKNAFQKSFYSKKIFLQNHIQLKGCQ